MYQTLTAIATSILAQEPEIFSPPSTPQMRRALDPCWESGLGFGTVKRTRADLQLPWEGETFGFIAADKCFLDDIQSALLAQSDPVPLPWPKQSRQSTQAPAEAEASRPQPVEATGQPS